MSTSIENPADINSMGTAAEEGTHGGPGALAGVHQCVGPTDRSRGADDDSDTARRAREVAPPSNDVRLLPLDRRPAAFGAVLAAAPDWTPSGHPCCLRQP